MHALKVDVRIQLVEHKPLKFEKSMLDHFPPGPRRLRSAEIKKYGMANNSTRGFKGNATERSKIDDVFGSALNQSERRRNWNDMGDLLRIAIMEMIHLVIRYVSFPLCKGCHD